MRVKFVGYHPEESHRLHICQCSLIKISYTVDICFKELITDRLALLAQSVCMRPSVQGLLWDEFDGLSEDKLKILFLRS